MLLEKYIQITHWFCIFRVDRFSYNVVLWRNKLYYSINVSRLVVCNFEIKQYPFSFFPFFRSWQFWRCEFWDTQTCLKSGTQFIQNKLIDMEFTNIIPRIFFDLQSLYPLHFGKIMAQQLSFQMSTSIFVWYVYVFYAFERGSYSKSDFCVNV